MAVKWKGMCPAYHKEESKGQHRKLSGNTNRKGSQTYEEEHVY